MTSAKHQDRIRLRIKLQPSVVIGPGKADVLRGIRETGSISATGRLIGMSYKRTWDLVNILNHDYGEPLIRTSTGGPRGGGASLTPLGEKVLGLYESLLDKAATAISKELAQLTRLSRKDGSD